MVVSSRIQLPELNGSISVHQVGKGLGVSVE